MPHIQQIAANYELPPPVAAPPRDPPRPTREVMRDEPREGDNARWYRKGREILASRRANAETWPFFRRGPIPSAAWTVIRSHANDPNGMFCITSRTEELVLVTMLDIAKAGKDGSYAIGDHKYVMSASHSELAQATGLSYATIRRTLKQLQAKYCIQPDHVRTRGEKGPANKQATVYLIRPFAEVLSLLRADPSIHKDPNRYLWTNGRPNSRRFLTPAVAAVWEIDGLPAPRSHGTRLPGISSDEPKLDPETPFFASEDTTAIVARLVKYGFEAEDPEAHILIKQWRRLVRKEGEELDDDKLEEIVEGIFTKMGRIQRMPTYYDKAVRQRIPRLIQLVQRERQAKEKAAREAFETEVANARAAIREGDELLIDMYRNVPAVWTMVVEEYEAKQAP